MTCPSCGRDAAPDAQTGYDCDDLCPSCAELAEYHRNDGTINEDFICEVCAEIFAEFNKE